MKSVGYTVLLGGVRSGKSVLAQRMGLAQRLPVTVIATAEHTDEEMKERILRHKAERPVSWRTIEEPLRIGDAVHAARGQFLIIDCLTVWLGNMLHYGYSFEEVWQSVSDFQDALRLREEMSVVVSNEVGLGVHPETELGRSYRDLLGALNTRLVADSTQAFMLIAGRLLRLESPNDYLDLADGS